MIVFEWDDGNIGKISKRFNLDEIEAIFFQDLLLFFDLKHSDSAELRFIAIGNISDKNPIFVCFTLRGERTRVISARYMRKKEQVIYEKLKKEIEKNY